MLHWHPWWLHTTDSSSRVPTYSLAVTWPRDGAVVPPEPAGADDADAKRAEPAEPHKTPYAIKRRRPVASGAARAKLDRQRKR